MTTMTCEQVVDSRLLSTGPVLSFTGQPLVAGDQHPCPGHLAPVMLVQGLAPHAPKIRHSMQKYQPQISNTHASCQSEFAVVNIFPGLVVFFINLFFLYILFLLFFSTLLCLVLAGALGSCCNSEEICHAEHEAVRHDPATRYKQMHIQCGIISCPIMNDLGMK